tara:strand:- start:7011 stop:7733 length:723 start_codon:yes stop_codon:yes gene_type:complete
MFGVNMNECEITSIDKYETFCDFFTRKLKKGIHKVDNRKKIITSPCDGKILEFGEIKNNSIVQIKGKYISVESILNYDKELAYLYKDGSYVTFYLSPKDYHRVHMPYDGNLHKTIHIPGRLFSVAAHGVKMIKSLYSVNERLVCSFKNDKTNFSVIFVGAINVSSIEVNWKGEISPPYPKKTITTSYSKKLITIKKGCEVGMFKTGSSVILLFDKNIKPISNVKRGKLIRMGEAIAEIKN